MVHIFRGLACLALLLLIANGIWAWLSVDDVESTTSQLRTLQESRSKIKKLRTTARTSQHSDGVVKLRTHEDNETQLVKHLDANLQRSSLQFLFLLATSLVAMLVNSITITYFIGTSRWCKEVVETYSLDTQLALQSATCKRQAFPWAMIGIATVLWLSAHGGAANPSVRLISAAPWGTSYAASAALCTVIMAFCFRKQTQYLAQNFRVIETILDDVQLVQNGQSPSTNAP